MNDGFFRVNVNREILSSLLTLEEPNENVVLHYLSNGTRPIPHVD